MGYLTYYEMEVHPKEKKDEVLHTLLSLFKTEDRTITKEEVEEIVNDMSKWYNHEEDLRKASEMVPDTTIILYGNGEEFNDFWKLYVKNGESERCNGYIEYVKPEKEWL